MILIIGLGNPGKKYEKTRHNIGFRVVDKFFKKNRDRMIIPCRVVGGLESNFSNFKLEKKFQALISGGFLGNKKIILAKPQIFMNNSGKSIKFLTNQYLLKRKIKAMTVILRQLRNLWIIHDDIDLPLGKIRIAIGRGAAGHKGVESIIKELGTKNFVRFRIGIKSKSKIKNQKSKSQFKIQNLENFVLKKFTKIEEKVIREIIEKTVAAIKFSLKEGLEKAMNKFNN